MAGHDDDKSDGDATKNVKIKDSIAEVEINENNLREEYDFLDSKLDELNSALDFLEQKNDDIHEKLKQLLQSNIDIRQQFRNENIQSTEGQSSNE